MCYGCYLDYGAPTMRSRAVRAAAEVIQTFDGPASSWSWGGLHIVFEDENLDAGSIDYCLAKEGLSDAERGFAIMLKGMTLKARVSAFGLARGYFR